MQASYGEDFREPTLEEEFAGRMDAADRAARAEDAASRTDNDEFRIEYTITRRRAGQDEDFTEIGFGTSGTWSSLEQCAHMLTSDVQNKQWETTGGMPDPEEV